MVEVEQLVIVLHDDAQGGDAQGIDQVDGKESQCTEPEFVPPRSGVGDQEDQVNGEQSDTVAGVTDPEQMPTLNAYGADVLHIGGFRDQLVPQASEDHGCPTNERVDRGAVQRTHRMQDELVQRVPSHVKDNSKEQEANNGVTFHHRSGEGHRHQAERYHGAAKVQRLSHQEWFLRRSQTQSTINGDTGWRPTGRRPTNASCHHRMRMEVSPSIR